MKQKKTATGFVCLAAALAASVMACTATSGDEESGATQDAVVGSEKCMLPGGTDTPGAEAPRCRVVAPAGAKLRATASATAAEKQPVGWGGLPCGWEMSLTDTAMGTTVSSCSLWGNFEGKAQGKRSRASSTLRSSRARRLTRVPPSSTRA